MPFYVRSPLDCKFYRLLKARDRFKFPKELVFRASNNIQAKELAGPYSFRGNLVPAPNQSDLWSQIGYWFGEQSRVNITTS